MANAEVLRGGHDDEDIPSESSDTSSVVSSVPSGDPHNVLTDKELSAIKIIADKAYRVEWFLPADDDWNETDFPGVDPITRRGVWYGTGRKCGLQEMLRFRGFEAAGTPQRFPLHEGNTWYVDADFPQEGVRYISVSPLASLPEEVKNPRKKRGAAAQTNRTKPNTFRTPWDKQDTEALTSQLAEIQARHGRNDAEAGFIAKRLHLLAAAASCEKVELIDSTAIDAILDEVARFVRGSVNKHIVNVHCAVAKAARVDPTVVSAINAPVILVPVHSENPLHWQLLAWTSDQPNEVKRYDTAESTESTATAEAMMPAFARLVPGHHLTLCPNKAQRQTETASCGVHVVNFGREIAAALGPMTREDMGVFLLEQIRRETELHRTWCEANGRQFVDAAPARSPAEKKKQRETARRLALTADEVADTDGAELVYPTDAPIELAAGFIRNFPRRGDPLDAVPPAAAGITWEDLNGIRLHGETLIKLPWLASFGQDNLALETRQRHRLHISTVLNQMPDDLKKLPLPEAVLTQLLRSAKQRNWTEPTFHRNLCSTQGALARLHLYCNVSQPILLAQDLHWREAVAKAGKLARESEKVNAPLALTKDQYETVRSTTSDMQKRMFLTIAWRTCSRFGCAAQLRREDLRLEGRLLTVTFRRGKGVTFRGPYSVHTTLTEAESQDLATYLAENKAAEERNLFPSKTIAVDTRDRMRTVDKNLTQRAVRRGALQALAAVGTDEATLMLFSGHRSVDTLRRYLDWGRVRSGDTEKMNIAQNKLQVESA